MASSAEAGGREGEAQVRWQRPAQGLTVAEHRALPSITLSRSSHCPGPPHRNEGSAQDPLFPSQNLACSPEPRQLSAGLFLLRAEGSQQVPPCWGRPWRPGLQGVPTGQSAGSCVAPPSLWTWAGHSGRAGPGQAISSAAPETQLCPEEFLSKGSDQERSVLRGLVLRVLVRTVCAHWQWREECGERRGCELHGLVAEHQE